MSAAVETMAYVGQTPWHGLGNEIPAGLNSEEMLTAAGLDWEVETAKAMWAYKDEDGRKRQRTSDDTRILFRKDTGADLSMVGKRYQPFQNREVLSFFNEYVGAGDAVIETAGSLQGGKYIWALADLGSSFDVGTTKNPDSVQGKVLLMNPHAYGKAAVLKMTEVRVVCFNTLTSALKDGSESGSGTTRRSTLTVRKKRSVDSGSLVSSSKPLSRKRSSSSRQRSHRRRPSASPLRSWVATRTSSSTRSRTAGHSGYSICSTARASALTFLRPAEAAGDCSTP